MAKTVKAKAVCEKCEADVREGTAFCYNCGSPLAQLEEVSEPDAMPEVEESAVDDKTKAALDDLAEKLRFDEEEDKKLARAAAERKRARVSQRKTLQYTWEPSEDSSGALLLILALVIGVIAGIVVFITVFWR